MISIFKKQQIKKKEKECQIHLEETHLKAVIIT